MAQLYRVGNKPAGDGNGRWHCRRTVSDAVFRFIAATRLQEIFTATALLLVIGTLAMQQVGLSPALGTFVARSSWRITSTVTS